MNSTVISPSDVDITGSRARRGLASGTEKNENAWFDFLMGGMIAGIGEPVCSAGWIPLAHTENARANGG